MSLIPDDVIAHWGQFALLEDFLTVLHRDGTPTYRRRWVMILHGVQQIQGWERFEYRFALTRWAPSPLLAAAKSSLTRGRE